MKVYRGEWLYYDFEDYKPEDVKNMLKDIHAEYFNCISFSYADIGEWHDDHPLNKYNPDLNAYNWYQI